MNIYKPNVVDELIEYYGSILDHNAYDSVTSHLSALVEKLYRGAVDKVSCIYTQLNNYNPKFIGKSVPELMKLDISVQDCKETIALEYGFESWEKVVDYTEPYNHQFENAVGLILAGDIESLKDILTKHPELSHQSSQYGHKATLLHYTASNGVELWRQQVPLNIAEVAKLLIKHGARTSAKMNVYGGQFDTISLAKTSAHPYEAGVNEHLFQVLA